MTFGHSTHADAASPAMSHFDWTWAGASIACGVTRLGAGSTALLLPALSSISIRSEMWPLQQRLAARHATIAVDWPGFGGDDKPPVRWTPEAMAAWLSHVLTAVAPDPALIVAAGHAAGYVLRHYAGAPAAAPRLALVAPTWRGPLPTMMGRRPDWLGRVRSAMDTPVLGQALYGLNLNDFVVRKMASGHVYSDPAFLTPALMSQKRRIWQAHGARFASVRFVTGALDPFLDPETARAAAAALPADRVQFIWGADAPRKSKAEMEALAAAAGVAPTVLPHGKLGVHEEFAEGVADAILGDGPAADRPGP